ncbi:hypothetical protein [Microbacterium phyllosphaerae]|uniref:hypothetical protein n=1 Tax=Microbacterium phyllosphaerae TaxID=124798 RepID=UPI002166E36E|nr:hypothetical protein [Microbacterium phyllosphaerae]MCS3442209.1 hypothetical protein [Microbacterium phyllosphaerae]
MTDDLRALQKDVYGPGGKATAEQRARLARLQNSTLRHGEQPDGEPDAEEAQQADLVPQEEEAPPIPPRRPRRRWVRKVGESVLLLAVGAGGSALTFGMASTTPEYPVTGVVLPAAANMFDPEVVVYFGEVEGFAVWSAPDVTGVYRCVAVSREPDDSVGTCGQIDDPSVVLLVPDGTTGRGFEFTVTVPSDGGKQRLSVSPVNVVLP